MKDLLLALLCTAMFQFVSAQNQTYKLDSLVDSYHQSGAPGLAVGVMIDGELMYQKHVGLANLEYDVPINDSTVFGIASITKQMTAACIGVLEHAGKLSVDDDVRLHVPELPDFGETIQIKHLLHHTSGLRNHNVLLDLQGFDYEHQGYTNESIQQLIFSQKGTNHSPGERMLYTNSNYVLLALIIERVSGKSLPEFADEFLFQPLGLENTFYRSSLHQIVKNRAYSYYKNGTEYAQPKSLTLCIGAGGVGSTVLDLLKWAQIYQGTTGFNWLSGFLTTKEGLTNGGISHYARGVFVHEYRGLRTVNHGGRDLGMRSQLICLPAYLTSVVVLTNSEDINAEAISYEILDLILETEEDFELKESENAPITTSLSALVNEYQELNSDLGMSITLADNQLYAKSSFGREPIPLERIGNLTFQRKGASNVTYTFYQDSKVSYHLVVDFGGGGFYFEEVDLVDPKSVNLTDFVGRYFSEELNVEYRIYAEYGKLKLDYPNNIGITLNPGQLDEFGSGRRTRYCFERNESGRVTALKVSSEGTVKDIRFDKQE